MHILLVSPAYAPDLGGGERYVYHLSRALVAHGHQVSVVTSNARAEADFWEGRRQADPVTVEKEGDLTIIRCLLPGFKGGDAALRAWRRSMIVLSTLPRDQKDILSRMAQHVPPISGVDDALARLREVDLIHGFNLSWEHALVRAWHHARKQGRPFVVTPFAHVGTSRAARNVSMDHQRALLMDADHVQALSVTEREGLVLWGIPESRIDVVGSGYVPPREMVDGRQERGITGRYAIYIGRLTYDKGAIHAVEAILALRRRSAPLELVLVGDSTAAFDKFYEQLTAAEQRVIHPVGRIDEASKHGLLAHADALLLPSRADALGIVLLEAWAHEKPVIAARAGGIPGVVDDGTNGFLVPFGDVRGIAARLNHLLENPDRAREMGRKGHQKVIAHYSWSAVVERILRGYKQAGETFTYRTPTVSITA